MTKTMDLSDIKESYNCKKSFIVKRVTVCAGTGCIASGALDVFDALVEKSKKVDIPVVFKLEDEIYSENAQFSKSGCQGFCQKGPLVTILPENIQYNKVTVDDVEEIVQATLLEGKVIERLLYKDLESGKTCKGQEEIPFYKKQTRKILKGCGSLDPESIGEYISVGGYEGAEKAFCQLSSEEICKTILDSGLRGRGGGGFNTGFKWELTRKSEGDQKYVICNGDEGDPGAFMDRSIMEGNPHSVIEGMMIAARAIGADKGYVYVRAEYPLAVERLEKAVIDAEQAGFLGENLFGTEHGFTLKVMEGAGAFVCGEETALISSIEGKRGMPRPKPPFPAESGLFGKPTVINNVETLASVPIILVDGAEEFKSVGTEKSPGTKTFALTGHVANTGLIEVPFGSTLREIIFDIGGGVIDHNGKVNNDLFKAVQIGGPSGACLTEKDLDLPLDFDSLRSIGAMVGSGGLVVMNKETCMVKVAKFFMQFTQNESCGKCVLCREGTKQMLSILDDITKGEAEDKDIDTLRQLANAVQKGSLCGLGKTAPNPILSTLSNFYEEVMSHIHDKKCPTGKCSDLAEPEIVAELCKGCGLCIRKCPVDAIVGEKRKPHQIDTSKCIKCGECAKACKFKAVLGV